MCSKLTLTCLQYMLVYTLTHTHTTCPQCYPSCHVSYRGMKTMLHLLIIMGNKISLNDESDDWHDYRLIDVDGIPGKIEEGWMTGRFKKLTNHFMTCASFSFGHEIHSGDFQCDLQLEKKYPTTTMTRWSWLELDLEIVLLLLKMVWHVLRNGSRRDTSLVDV